MIRSSTVPDRQHKVFQINLLAFVARMITMGQTRCKYTLPGVNLHHLRCLLH